MTKLFNKKIFWIIIVAVDLLVVLLTLALFNHDFPDASVNQKEEVHLIGESYMTMNNEYFRIISETINSKVEAEGDRIVIRDPALDVDRQITQINEMLGMGIDALVVTPVDWMSLSAVLKEAKDRGVKIIVVDSNVADENLIDMTITSDNYQAGKLVGDYFLSQNNTANIVLMTHNTAKSGRDRMQGFREAIAKNNNIHVVEEIECEGQTEIAMPRLKEFISSGKTFDTVFCLNDLASVGVVAALDDNNLLDQVKVYGVDASPDSKALIYEGMMQATIAQFPIKIGESASENLYKLFNGERVEKDVKVPVKLINKDNVEEFGIDRWQ